MSTKTQMTITQDDDEISFRDIVDCIKIGWHWLVGGVLLGGLGALWFVAASPDQYEASAVIQSATVGITPNFGDSTAMKGLEVEPVVQTLERVKQPTFYTEMVLQACQASSQQQLASSLKAVQLKSKFLIQLSYRANSAAVARVCMNAVLDRVAQAQAEISEPLIKRMEEGLVLTRRQLAQAEAYQVQLEKRAALSDEGASLMVLNRLTKREEILRLQKLLIEQEMQLSPPLTQTLQLLEPVYVSRRVALPNALVLVGGMFGGLVFGGLAFFVRRSWLVRCK